MKNLAETIAQGIQKATYKASDGYERGDQEMEYGGYGAQEALVKLAIEMGIEKDLEAVLAEKDDFLLQMMKELVEANR